jgi:hypothetical protein
LRFLIDLAVAVVIATVIGFTSAWFAVEHGPLFGAVKIREWTAWPAAGSPDADPYSLAVLARTGEVPLGTGEGLAFSAETDSDGRPLSGECQYEVIGQTPAARLWTLTAYDKEGRLMVNAARRSGFHSGEVLRHPDGSFTIEVSPDVQPGNWLPVGRVEAFRLVLRLYDTPLTSGGRFTDLVMPDIRRVRC